MTNGLRSIDESECAPMSPAIINDVLKLYILGSEDTELILPEPYLQVLGNGLANRITGNTLNNSLDGGAGSDTLVGGAGNDVYGVDDATDVIVELNGEGIDTVYASVNFTLGEHLEHLIMTGSGAINGAGNDVANRIAGNAGGNLLFGFKGDDTIDGGAGRDNLSGGDGNDVLDGGTDIDTLSGGSGDDTYYVDSSLDSIFEGADEGMDTVVATVGYVLSQHVEGLTLAGAGNISGTGNARDNVILGNDGNNVLEGREGADTLGGGLGFDMLTGGEGRDVFLFNTRPAATNLDIINDFTIGQDRIQLENAVFTKLSKAGRLKGDFFTTGARARDGNDFVGYNKTTGELWYDANGRAAGGQQKIAMLEKGLALTAAHFFVI